MDRKWSKRVVYAVVSLSVALTIAVAASPALAARLANQGLGGKFEAVLLGSNEVNGGDPDGSGHATLRIIPAEGKVCFDITVKDVAPITLGHIHSGAAGVNGPVVVDFMVPVNGLSGCVTGDPAITKAIIRNPSAYYVNVHNADFPGGAVRGQLTK